MPHTLVPSQLAAHRITPLCHGSISHLVAGQRVHVPGVMSDINKARFKFTLIEGA